MKRLRRTGDELLEYEGTNTWLQMEVALNWTMGLIPDKLYGMKNFQSKAPAKLTADGGYTNGGFTDTRTGSYVSDSHDTPHYEESYGMGGWYDNEEFGYGY